MKSAPVLAHVAARISKTFALKFLRKAFFEARIQRIPVTDDERARYDAKGGEPDPTLETWQVWAKTPVGKGGVVQVTAPRAVLPFSVVREAYRCVLHMEVNVEVNAGSVRMTATKLPPQPAAPEGIDS